MKKFFAVLGCLLAFAGIVVLCYFFGYPNQELEVPVGEYYLETIVEQTGDDDSVETEYTNGDLYLKVYSGNRLRSFSGDKGLIGSELIYDFKLSGTNLTISYEGHKEHEAMFSEELIIIETSETIDIDGEETKRTTYYYYRLKN